MQKLTQTISSVLPFLISGLLPLVFSSFFIGWVLEHNELFLQLSWFEVIIYTLIASLIMGLMLSPTTFIALLSGFILGWKAIPFVIVSYLLASVIGFFIGKLLDHGKVERLLSLFPKGKIFFDNIQKTEKQLVFTCRLSPVLPFAFTNVLLAAIKTRFSTFIVFGTLGMLPRTLLAIWAGKQASSIYDLQTQQWTLSSESILLFVLVGVSMLVLTLIIKNTYQKSVS